MNSLNLQSIVLVGVGSFFGGVFRYITSFVITKSSDGFPWSTLAVNISGSLILGFLFALLEKNQLLSQSLFLLLGIGFCGGFTTFSTFSLEGLQLLRNQQWSLFTLYAISSLILGITACASGYFLLSKLKC